MKEIRVRVNSSGFEGIVKGFGGNDMVLVEFPTGVLDWFPQHQLSVIVDAEEIEQYIADNMNTVFAIKDPKGMPFMRQVRLVVGEGDDKVEVGVATVQPVLNDDTKVILKITHPRVAQMLGGDTVIGTIPRYVEPPAEEEQTNG